MTRDLARERLEAKRWSISTWLLTLDEPAIDDIDALVMRKVAEARDRFAASEPVEFGLEELRDSSPTIGGDA